MKENFIKIKEWLGAHLPTKRRIIQLYSALLFNANLKGYISGDIFKGLSKNACTPGLNCYSCPGAVTACPLGALQNAFSESRKTTPYYIFGIIMLYCIMFGRWICGWLCPFGLFQDLVYKIKTPKLKKSRITKALSCFKYFVLAFFVVIIPLAYAFRDFPLPGFCKYICPAGTLGGAVALLINPANADKFGMLGPLFTWKFALLVSFTVAAVFIYRVFCRFVCPLGAIYGIFNKIALFGIKLEKKSCVDCGKCITTCKMDITTVGDRECINCGDCISVCPTQAISWRGSKIILPDNEIRHADTEKERELAAKRLKKRKKTVSIVVASLLGAVLAVTLIYANFIDKPASSASQGSEIGDACYSMELELVDGNGETVSIEDFRGKVVVVNFWGTWCGPCKEELPHFNELASEYGDSVVFLIVHTDYTRESASAYINDNFPDSRMIFVYDEALTKNDDKYFTELGGTSSYPRTLVLDSKGIITFAFDGKLEKSELAAEINNTIMNK